MSRSICLTLPVNPPTTTAQMKRLRFVNGKPRFFHLAKLRAEADGWGLWLRKYAPREPFTGPVFVRVSLEYPHTQASRKLGTLVPKTSRPDVDGAVKHIIDAMQGAGYFVNDAQVQRLEVTKWHGDRPAIDIQVGPAV
jgi:Holliday junction resolvase RusA-like endonuclease